MTETTEILDTPNGDNLPVIVGDAAMVHVIERAASDPRVDIDKLERLLQLKERIDARNAEVAFNAAMRAAQEEMPSVYRDAENSHTRSRYARLESVNQAVVPVYTRHGFSLSFGTADSKMESFYRVTCIVSHAAGHSRNYQCDIPADNVGAKGNANKTDTHAFGSTMSYARRYLTLLIFNITLTNDDNDANPNPQPTNDPEAPKAAPRGERTKADAMTVELAAAWKVKNPQNVTEPKEEYRERFNDWCRLMLGVDLGEKFALTEKNIPMLMEKLK